MYSITPIPAFTDNYIWAIANPETGAVIVVDPGDAAPVEKFLASRRYSLIGILVTHHHRDHTGGVQALKEHYQCPVYGFRQSKIDALTQRVSEGDRFSLMGLEFEVIEVPGHTLDHVAYLVREDLEDPALFCGDTLFSGGCGRLFEGNAAMMFASLCKLKALPARTRVYCTHEYTLANLAFARAAMPDNQDLSDYRALCERTRAAGNPTLPSTMETELKINPFLRFDTKELQASVQQSASITTTNEIEIFTALRKWKDKF
jgi:hydroxyacylglutathione hydrolase